MKTVYTKCAQSVKGLTNQKRMPDIGRIYLFDVTLRDGLQGLTKEQQTNFSLQDKMKLYSKIKALYEPEAIEIGSIVNESVLPIFKDTLKFLDSIKKPLIGENDLEDTFYPNHYILIPSKEKLSVILHNTNINHLSFITSVSNSFQLKNTKKTLEQGDKEIYEMLYMLDDVLSRKYPPQIKLYVSCINECPIEGKIDNDIIVDRLLQLQKMNVDNICISDTCGTLDPYDFEYIVTAGQANGLNLSKLSLHLHVNPGRECIVESIIHIALDNKIRRFDVSLLQHGGCSVTMDPAKLAANLSYDLFYSSLYNYIVKRKL
jgi:isopropylmalate/homocitrate/citramalate synthase